MPDQEDWNLQSLVWIYKTKKEPSIASQFLSTMLSTITYVCCVPPKKEKCGRCCELIRPIEGSSKVGCDPTILHLTCDCFLRGDYFRTDIDQTRLWRESKEKQVERFIENFCCIRAAAFTTLNSDQTDEIIARMDKLCDCQNNMYTCNASCCGPTSSCMKAFLNLCENNCSHIWYSQDHISVLRNIVNGNNKP